MMTARTLVSRLAPATLALAVAVTVGSFSTAARGDDTLRWKFTKGQKLNYVFNQETVTKSEAMGQKFEFTMTQIMDLTWDIKDVDDKGVAQMDQTIDRIVYTMKGGPVGEVVIDTNKDEKLEGPLAALAPTFKALTKSPFSLKMNPRGEVSDVQVPAKVVDALKNAGPLAQAGGEMFTEKGLKDLTGQATIVLPEGAVAKGYHWATDKSLKLPFGTMDLVNTYTYDGLSDGGLNRIGVDVKVDVKPSDGSNLDIKIGNQDNKGAFLFDNAKGVLQSSSITQKMEMKIKVMGQEVTQNLSTKVSMEPAKATASR